MFNCLDFFDHPNQSSPSESATLPTEGPFYTDPTDSTVPAVPTLPTVPTVQSTDKSAIVCQAPLSTGTGSTTFNMKEYGGLNIISPDNFNSKIAQLMEAIKLELGKSGGRGQGPNNPYDFLSKLLASSQVSDEEFDKLSKLVKNNDFSLGVDKEASLSVTQLEAKKVFYAKIPRFHNYAEFMASNIQILNDNIYISENFAHILKPTLQTTNTAIIDTTPLPPVSAGAQPHTAAQLPLSTITLSQHQLFKAPSAEAQCVRLLEGRVLSLTDLTNLTEERVEGANFYFLISISDLFLHSTELKYQIDIQNKKVVPMDKIKYFEIWDFFKKYY